MKNYKILLTAVFSFFLGGLFFSSRPAESQSRYDKLRLYAQVFNLVEEHYIEILNVEDLVTSSIRGLLGKLDSYSGYLSKKTYSKFKKESNGGFDGIGFELTLKDRRLQIVSVIEGTPAWNSGLLPKDQILEINGERIFALDFTEATQSLAGKAGKKIKLLIKRPGKDEAFFVKLKRKKLKLKAARKVLKKGELLVVRLTSFSTGAAKELKAILEKEQPQKLLLDLRNNPGGLIDEAIETVDMFVENGVIVKTVSRTKEPEVSLAQKSTAIFKDVVVSVLVDGASASASEIVASSLKDLKKAKVYGVKTYGKGSVQSVIPLPNGQGGVKLTIARYFTASNKMIDKKGLKPDVAWPEKTESSNPVQDVSKDKLLQWALEKM